MKKILRIFEKKEIIPYLQRRGVLKQYKKAKTYLLSHNLLPIRFKERKPKGSGIWCFRINRQYRAIGVFDDERNLIVFKIDNHQ